LLVLGSLWSLPVLFMLAVPVFLTIAPVIQRSVFALFIEDASRCQRDLEVGSLREFVVSSVTPSPVLPLAALVQREADMRQGQQLQEAQEWVSARQQEFCEATGGGDPKGSEVVTTFLRAGQTNRTLPIRQRAAGLIATVNAWQSEPAGLPETDFSWLSVVLVAGGLIAGGPVLWVLWAFLFRGGWTLWLMGILLVRADGRKAARWQCAWRVLLLWLPVCGLLATAIWLTIFWWYTDFGPSYVWATWLSWSCWGLAVVLLPLYATVAVLFPNRSLHDWLAGTYLVPR
jgi:hypothetical protein